MKTPKKQPVEVSTYQYSSLPSLNDRILIFTRSHIFYLSLKIFFNSVIGFILALVAGFSLTVSYPSFIMLIFSETLILTFIMTLNVNEFINWYFHFYLVTKRKIVEVWNTPFGKYFINEIMLDRVKCTEVDISSNGFINQVLRIGDVIVTFDRPTQHRDSFVFHNIANANSIREILSDYFSEDRKETTTWYVFDRHKGGLTYPLDETIRPRLHA